MGCTAEGGDTSTQVLCCAHTSTQAKQQKLVFNFAFYREPVQIHQQGGDVTLLLLLHDKAGSMILNGLEGLYFTAWEINQ